MIWITDLREPDRGASENRNQSGFISTMKCTTVSEGIGLSNREDLNRDEIFCDSLGMVGIGSYPGCDFRLGCGCSYLLDGFRCHNDALLGEFTVTQIQMNLDVKREPVFHGKTFERALDQERLKGQLGRVWEAMKDGHYRTLRQLSLLAKAPEASCSSRLRDLRKMGFDVESKRDPKNPKSGSWVYRVRK